MRRRTAAVGVVLAAVLAAAWWLLSDRPPPEGSSSARREASAGPARARRASAPRERRTPSPAPAAAVPEEAPAAAEVRCAVGDALDGWPIRLFRRDDGEPLGWRLEEGDLVFAAPASAGEALLTWGRGWRAAPGGDSSSPVTWSGAGGPEATCAVDHLPAPLDAAVFGRVRGAERLPEGSVFLEGCGLQQRGELAPIDVDGGFFFHAQAGACQVRAWRRAGQLRVPGPWVEVDAATGADAEVDLEVPTYEPAGMGILFGPAQGGISVNGVHEGTPAAAAGLGPGDVITAIDGAATEGMEAEDFLLHGIGPAGTDVQLEGVTSEGEPFAVVVTRAPIR